MARSSLQSGEGRWKSDQNLLQVILKRIRQCMTGKKIVQKLKRKFMDMPTLPLFMGSCKVFFKATSLTVEYGKQNINVVCIKHTASILINGRKPFMREDASFEKAQQFHSSLHWHIAIARARTYSWCLITYISRS
ncbi:serine/threonine-protein kinase ULK2-like protein [Corchorus olitorius]|uniref:Serine/threonine-protein kinase ULK2-like protein n=1 Tax=Corchorus olitorius TaxID=93759 RepID=A0A1R3K7F7_9ROSI|nr:serine/threonine-protein kinase ULK2-like protein [Corchorus olitorius]